MPLVVNEHILLEGHVAWNTDYHEYFEIRNISKAIPTGSPGCCSRDRRRG